MISIFKQFNKEDDSLLKKIKARIRWDIRVSNSDIYLKVKNSVVTLDGCFDKPYRHAAAVNIIKSTDGVTEFKDKSVTVGDYFRTDKELQTLITEQIKTLTLGPEEWIEVSVQSGVVKLIGSVSKPRHKAFASRSVWELSGIKDCLNQIEIGNSSDTLFQAEAQKNNLYQLFPNINERKFKYGT
jgi:osmotically-inducible protein OsmY